MSFSISIKTSIQDYVNEKKFIFYYFFQFHVETNVAQKLNMFIYSTKKGKRQTHMHTKCVGGNLILPAHSWMHERKQNFFYEKRKEESERIFDRNIFSQTKDDAWG